MNKGRRAPSRGVSTTNSNLIKNPAEIKILPGSSQGTRSYAELRAIYYYFISGKCSIYKKSECCWPKPIMCYFKALIFLIILITLIIIIALIIIKIVMRFVKYEALYNEQEQPKSPLERGTAEDCDENTINICIELLT